jgi:HlyD family secretion protein
MRSILSLILFGAVLVIFVSSGCKPPEAEMTGSGTIEATDVLLSAPISSQILELPVSEGDSVKAGDAIARFDTEGLELERAATAAGLQELDAAQTQATAQIAQSKAVLDGAKKTYDRAVELKTKGAISAQQYDDAGTACSIAQKQLETAKTALEPLAAKRSTIDARIKVLDYQISQGKVISPISGTVLEKYTEIGERLVLGKPVVKLADLSSVWVKIYVGEQDLARIKLNDPARVFVDGLPGKIYEGKVTWISSQAEFTPKNVQTRDARADLVYAVKITIQNSEGIFKIGMPVDVDL